ncbi:MAG: ABC transporter permease subunit, partial [Candidatus Binatia bacterium]|nr:ABC transporter permease subunit [Candidatus Binatia bacterium]
STTLEDGKRTISPKVAEGQPLQIDPQGRALAAVVYREGDGKTAAAAVVAGSRSVLFFAQQEKTATLFGPGGVAEYRAELSPVPDTDISALALDKYQTNLLVGTASGEILHWDVSDPEAPVFRHRFLAGQQPGIGVSALGWVLGDRSLIVGDTAGNVSVWFQVRDPQDPTLFPYRRIHVLRAHDAPVTAVAPSPRDKGFISADRNGTIFLHHATSTQTLLALPAGTGPISLLTMAPKADGIYAVAADTQLLKWFLHNPHPEITLRALFGKVWYEGYDHPDYTWQSSSGSDEFEPKFSLTPLAYGTLKGTFYALLLAVPLSVCGAIYTSQFLHPRFRNLIKPTVEVMAALPSVVLGFFAGLWLAPRVEQVVPGVFLMFFALPAVTFAASLLWRLVPPSFRSRLKPGAELFFLAPLLVLTAYVCIRLNDPIEAAFFAGNFPQWLFDTTGVRYDPRNSLVVGFAMGFAVVPIIYTICEDAFSNVPQHLLSGSFALGATRWQTALRVVLPTASPGVFSAVMIGFGRAVGETMIVLMATGNTPVMDFSPFSGFRALSANIAVEIPEAPHGGTLYRVLFLAALLLFILTFLVNTAAEVVRQRLRERYSRI